MTAEAEDRERLAQQIDLLSHASQKTIAYVLGTGLALGDRASEHEPLLATIGTAEHLRVLERSLMPEEWALLNLLPLQIGPFQLSAVVAPLRRRGATAKQALEVAVKLLSCAALLPSTLGPGRSKLSIEAEQIQHWATFAWLELPPSVAERARVLAGKLSLEAVEAPATILAAALPELRRAAFLLVAELRRKPLRLTTAGLPNKTDLRRIVLALDDTSGDGPRPSAAVPQVPSLLFLALGALLASGILRQDDFELRPSPLADDFFTTGWEQQALALFLGWCDSRFDDFACVRTLHVALGNGMPWTSEYTAPLRGDLNRARAGIFMAIARLVLDEPGAWYSIESLAQFIQAQFPDILFGDYDGISLFRDIEYFSRHRPTPPRRQYPSVYRRPEGDLAGLGHKLTLFRDTDWMEVEGAYIREVVTESMRFLGLTEAGPDSAEPDGFRLTALGQTLLLGKPPEQAPITTGTSRAAIVQPNFEIVVLDAAANFALLAELDAFAERRALDRAATYRLTQPALVRAFDQGWTGDRALAALETANGGPLPQNVRFSIEAWIRLYDSVTLYENATLLELDSSKELDDILAEPQLAGFARSRISLTAALIVPMPLLPGAAAEIREVDYSDQSRGALRVDAPDQIELLAGAAEPYVRYRLGALAEQIGERERGVVYQITPESVARAAGAGWQGRQLIDFLEVAAAAALPVELKVRLLGWSRSVAPLAAEMVTAVRLDAPDLDWEILRAIPSVNVHIRALLSGSVALIAATELEALRAELADLGLSIETARLPETSLTPVIPSSALQKALDQYWEGPHAIRRTLHALGYVGRPKSGPRRGKR